MTSVRAVRAVPVLVAVALLVTGGLAGCGERQVDSGDGGESTAVATRPSATVPPRSQPTTPGADPAEVEQAVERAVLDEQDLAGEGVRAVDAPSVASGCLAAVPVGLIGRQRTLLRWEYPTGSTLDQLVTGYVDRPAAEVLNGRVRCPGAELTLPSRPDVEAHRGWCIDNTCTLLLASGRVISGIQVSAGEQARARDAVLRIAPIAAAKLPANG
ncbi:hypothetical protein SacmaDRAFT_2832 [Saccharomonospora marina XMU15]|uniref:PknH-like extracellular domain-containing protein n=1 Tax=Saccharomonospora marina XMU15 TaxID=882083 RepID=H5X3Q8_9PSEU|nr:hypothetical protein [Saccharomonospora marina]EHR51071.1 hypothetical protein SacmaDRAFT_2832 [Saccharomonospora marina XMU15]